MRNFIAIPIIIFMLLCQPASAAAEGDNLVIYASVKESLMGKLQTAFALKHPEINTTWQSGGGGKLIDKITRERSQGQILADVLWTLEVPDFYALKRAGLLEKYISPVFAETQNPFEDFDGSFTAVRLGTVGIAYNTRLMKNPPSAWQDLTKPAYADGVSIADPTGSGAAYLAIVMLSQTFGWDFFQQLHANGGKIGPSAIQVVADTAVGDNKACFGVDYITYNVISKGASLALAYPPEMIVIPSPVAIIKGTKKLAAAQKFVDFILSQEAQTIIANEGTLPVRTDVPLPPGTHLPDPKTALQHAIKVDYAQLATEKEQVLKKFFSIMPPRGNGTQR